MLGTHLRLSEYGQFESELVASDSKQIRDTGADSMQFSEASRIYLISSATRRDSEKVLPKRFLASLARA